MKSTFSYSMTLAVVLGCSFMSDAAEIMRSQVPSPAMGRKIPVNIVLPRGYADCTNRCQRFFTEGKGRL